MITCANCQTQNPEDKKFCRECGTPIIPTAPSSPKQEAAQPPPPTTVASTKPVLSKKKSKWWIWLILVVVLAAVAYLAFFEGGMGSFLPVKKGSPGSSARNETDLIEKLVESFQNQDPYGFVDNYCLSRADLDEFNRLLPESSKFDVKEASGEIPEIASKLRDDWNEIMKRSNEVNWDWASTKVISVSSEKTDSNPKLFTGIYAVIESEGKRYGLFLESCAKFSVGFKVCKELEWTGKDDGSDPFSENQSDQGDKTTEDSLVKELARINPEEKATERVQAEQKKKIPDQKGLQKDDEGYYDLTYHDGRLFRYKGELLNGQAHGIGQAIFPDGYKYQGEFKNNKFDGEAIETFIDGVKFTGTFTNGYRHGTGTIIWINGSSYTGDWASGWRTGHGAYSWGDGARFEGEWKQNQRIHGKMLYADGNTYEGEYAEDVLHGNGTYTWANGNKYVGAYSKGNRTGKGVFYWSDGQRYEGDFIDNIRTGFGTYFWPDGGSFTGTFDNNERVQGEMKYGNGNNYNGSFIDGKKHGQGTYTWLDGSVYTGAYENGVKKGFGSMVWASGSRYSGYWVNDNQNGQGTYWWTNKSYWKGNFKDNKFHGQGIEYHADGQIRAQGTWVEGVYQK